MFRGHFVYQDYQEKSTKLADTGEKKAWDVLADMDPKGVQARADVLFNTSNDRYEIICFGRDICLSIAERSVYGKTEPGDCLVREVGEQLRLTLLMYLIHAKDIPLSGKLVRPSDLPGGIIYVKGTHVLPLDKIAQRYDNNAENFFRKSRELGGTALGYGDMSHTLFPFPRIPVVLIVWSGDDEFPPRCSLLFDASCTYHMPADIIWSTAKLTVDCMLS